MSFVAISTHILISGGYSSLAKTMLQNSVSGEELGAAISSYNLFTNIASLISPVMFGFVAQMLDLKVTGLYGPAIALFIVLGYLPSAYYYFRSGMSYKSDVLSQPAL